MSRFANSLKSVSRSLHRANMPAFTLYGARGSTNTDRVRLTLADAGFTDYETVMINLYKGEQKSPDNKSRNPWGKVPAITTQDGFTLYESRAISKYLAAKYSFPLMPLPSNLQATALFNQAECEETFYFAEPAGKIGFEKYVKPKMGLTTDEAAVSAAMKALEAYFDVAEELLSQRQYMAGDEFSLVDIYYIPLVLRLFECGCGDLITGRVAVSAWWDRCVSRPGIKGMLAADKEAAAVARK